VHIDRTHKFGKKTPLQVAGSILKGKTLDSDRFVKNLHSKRLMSKPLVNKALQELLPIYQQFTKLGEAHLSSEQLDKIRAKMSSVSSEETIFENFELLMSRYQAFRSVPPSAETRLSRNFKEFIRQLPLSIISKLFVPSTAAALTPSAGTAAEADTDALNNILLQLRNTEILDNDNIALTEIEKERYLVLLAVLIGAPNAIINEIIDNSSIDNLSTNETITVAHMASSDDLFKLFYFAPDTNAPKAAFNKLDAILFSIYGGNIERARNLLDNYAKKPQDMRPTLTNVYAALNMLQMSDQFPAGIKSEASRLSTELRERYEDKASMDSSTMRTPPSVTRSTESVDNYASPPQRLSELKGRFLGASLPEAAPDPSHQEELKDEPYSSGFSI
jgi:hypothetical protein